MRGNGVPALVFAALAAPSAAEPAGRGWQFRIEPWLMVPFMKGAAAIGPIAFHGSTSPRDLFASLNLGVMGMVEANTGRFGIAFDGA